MSTLERAIAIAVDAHSGQVDKAGDPYVLHPLRVMFAVESESERIAGVLHDVVEDTHWTLADLEEEGFSSEVVEALDALTRRPDETYMEFVERAGNHPIARPVKIADIRHNLDLDRIPELTQTDLRRLEKYREALSKLGAPTQPLRSLR